MIIIGIDPGLSGAIAQLGHRGDLIALHDMPIMMRGGGKSFIKNQVSPAGLAQLLREMIKGEDKIAVHVFIELVASGGGQGVASMFSFGHTAGSIEATVATLGLAMTLVPPTQWKRAMNLTKDKNHARAQAARLYPEASVHRVKDHNRAEALLIARYGWNQLK